MVHCVSSFHQQKELDRPEMVQEVVLCMQDVHQATGCLIHGLDGVKRQCNILTSLKVVSRTFLQSLEMRGWRQF